MTLQEFNCVAALLQLKLSVAPMEDVQQLLQEVKSLAQLINTSGSILYSDTYTVEKDKVGACLCHIACPLYRGCPLLGGSVI